MCVHCFDDNNRLFLETYRELAQQILVTGKSVNFLNDICDECTTIKGKRELKDYLASNG